MLFVKNSELEWVAFDDWHSMDAGFSDQLPSNESADIMFARIKPGATLGIHYHTRPLDKDGSDNGYESFFFFQGAHIELFQKEGSKILQVNEPFTATFFSHEHEMHGIKNLGETDLVFQVVCAPKFVETEEIQVI